MEIHILELRTLVLVSLFLQTTLIVFGDKRKYITNELLKFFIWLNYLSANWIATFMLGILYVDFKNPEVDPNFLIIAIWAPFLLVHLGGPDTITAYSLEDNELWLRHLFDLLSQLVVVVYVIYQSWNGSSLNYVTILVVVAGIIKYCERTWSLRSASRDEFRESILPPPDAGPNYAKFMDNYIAKEDEGYHVTMDTFIDITTPTASDHTSQGQMPNPNIPDGGALRDGFKFYNIPECLVADLIFSFQDHKSSQDFFRTKGCQHAFNVIAIELGLMYDMLYTKSVLTYSKFGIFLKSVSILCTLSALISFSFLKPKPITYDHIITFVLFGGAILLEIYAILVVLSSSRAMFWFSKHNNWGANFLYKCISWCQCFSHTVTWSNRMSQFNLIRFCLKDEPIKCIKIQKFLHIYKYFEKYYYKKTKQVSEELKELIFNELKNKSREATNIEECKRLCACKGDWVLEQCKFHIHKEQNDRNHDKNNCHICDINHSIKEVEFDQSILLWHIATDLCYYSEYSDSDDEPLILSPAALQSREKSQLLSDHMLNLLVICPFLLPNGIGQIRFEDTCAEVGEILEERKYIKERREVCKIILRVNTKIPPSKVKGDRSKSVLFDACRLAKSLQSLETKENWSKEKKWKMISNIWVEMLCHAASQCRGLNHAKQLSQGGELLTHVWLLMAHLGITEQFQISKGHVRAMLKLS
ncbi:uncharacterized protein LOC123909634 [Trifolium pratense]|uniref:uncharacterized protein LOC123909634 n=1 Tax=Trifolium pratense TaxID=57577 RepID=UPI001E690159|nr:uncharacterized protein LOC123909634 [Trifolium pratense]